MFFGQSSTYLYISDPHCECHILTHLHSLPSPPPFTPVSLPSLSNPPVPSQVRNLHARPGDQAASLRVSWTPGDGDVDMYTVSLSQGGHLLETRPVPKHVTELDFQGLIPGQLYGVEVQALSGILVNNSTTTGRTGEKEGGRGIGEGMRGERGEREGEKGIGEEMGGEGGEGGE